MRQSARNEDLLLVFGGQDNADPFAECRRAPANIDSYVENLASYHTTELRLSMRQLIVKTPNGSTSRKRVIVLHESIENAEFGKLFGMVALKEPATMVAENMRLDDDNAENCCLVSLKHRTRLKHLLIQNLQEVLTVLALHCLCQALKVGGIDVFHPEGNFLGAGNLQSLPLLHGLDELRRI